MAEMQTYSSDTSRRGASWLALVIVALLVGGIIGYYLGRTGVGSGLLNDADDNGTATTTETDIGAGADTQTEPFDDEYVNPFE